MTPQELKNSILQRAIEGKLVDQRPEEENVNLSLLNRAKKKKINTDKLFSIPKNWEWVNLVDICNLIGGYAFKSTKYIENGVRVIRISDFNENGLLDKDKKFYQEESSLSKYLINSNDILMCMTGGTVGKTVFLGEINDKLYLNQRVAAIRIENNSIINNDYLNYVIESNHIKKIINTKKNSTNDNISMKLIQHFPIPLPPLAEQKRIVEKIEDLMPLVDEYEKNWQKLEDLNKKFPEDMKKSLLQEAIKGKLVEQRPEEGSGEDLYRLIQEEKEKLIKEGKIKKQKSLPEITEEEIPFDIPESWKWVRINDCIDVRDGTHDTPKYVEEGYPLVTSKNLKNGNIDFSNCKFISKEDHLKISERSRVDVNDILFAMIGSIGNPVKVQVSNEFSIKNMALFKSIRNYFNMDYLYWFLYSSQYDMKKIAYGAVQSFVSLKFLREYLLPLPPLGEQKRIVEKLEELLPLCDQIIKSDN